MMCNCYLQDQWMSECAKGWQHTCEQQMLKRVRISRVRALSSLAAFARKRDKTKGPRLGSRKRK